MPDTVDKSEPVIVVSVNLFKGYSWNFGWIRLFRSKVKMTA